MKDATGKRLEKAAQAIHAAETLVAAGHPDFAAGRASYAMFYVAEALLFEIGLRFRSHGEIHGAFGQHFIKTGKLPADCHRWLIDAFDQRLSGDYWTEASVSEEDADRLIEQARRFLAEARGYLQIDT